MRVLLAQLAPEPGDPQVNLQRLAAAVERRSESDLAVFPELFLSGYDPDRVGPLALALDDPIVRSISEIATRTSTAIIVGFPELLGTEGVANSALCIDRDGTIAGVHRKTHPSGTAERKAFIMGETLQVVSLAGCRVGPLICFEMEFPETARALTLAGAELLVTIAANMAPYGDDHDLASRARALDNRRPHIYVNRVGVEAGHHFVGGSQSIDAGGRIRDATPDGDAIVVSEVSLNSWADPDVDYLRHLRGALHTDIVATELDSPDPR